MSSPEYKPCDDETSSDEKVNKKVSKKEEREPASKARKNVLGGSPAITKRVLRPR